VYDHGMSEALATAIEELDIPLDGAVLLQEIVLLERHTAKVYEAIGGFDAAQLWDLDGATSMRAWLSAAGMSGPDAIRQAQTAKRLRGLPVTAAGWRDGTLSGGQVQAVVANVPEPLVEDFADGEAGLVPLLARLSVADTARAVRHWRSQFDDRDRPEEPERRLHLSETLDGRHEISGHLDAEGGALVAAALRVADSGDRARSVSARQGEALVSVCRWFLDHQDTPTGRNRPHINVVVDLQRLDGGLLGGSGLDNVSIKRLLCDAGVHRVVTAGASAILDYGHTHRTVPTTLWSAVVLRDTHCRFPGCDRRSSWCEAHHLHHWADGGSTALNNLALLCSRHHHKCHQPGWTAKLLPDATFEVTTPDGRHLVSRPPP
jgi:hypothetical protein